MLAITRMKNDIAAAALDRGPGVLWGLVADKTVAGVPERWADVEAAIMQAMIEDRPVLHGLLVGWHKTVVDQWQETIQSLWVRDPGMWCISITSTLKEGRVWVERPVIEAGVLDGINGRDVMVGCFVCLGWHWSNW